MVLSIDVFLKLLSELYLLFAVIVKSHDDCERARSFGINYGRALMSEIINMAGFCSALLHNSLYRHSFQLHCRRFFASVHVPGAREFLPAQRRITYNILAQCCGESQLSFTMIMSATAGLCFNQIRNQIFIKA
jgi:hypothetical protein